MTHPSTVLSTYRTATAIYHTVYRKLSYSTFENYKHKNTIKYILSTGSGWDENSICGISVYVLVKCLVNNSCSKCGVHFLYPHCHVRHLYCASERDDRGRLLCVNFAYGIFTSHLCAVFFPSLLCHLFFALFCVLCHSRPESEEIRLAVLFSVVCSTLTPFFLFL